MLNKLVLSIIFILFLTTFCYAPPGPPPAPGCWPPPCVPIDGGISLLIAAGAIYGGKKLFYNKKNKNS